MTKPTKPKNKWHLFSAWKMTPWQPGNRFDDVEIADHDRELWGSPKQGDMVASLHGDRWLIPFEYLDPDRGEDPENDHWTPDDLTTYYANDIVSPA